MKSILKGLLQALSLALAFLPALTCGFGRAKSVFSFWAQSYALVPGLPGSYIRIAYYRLTLEACSLDSRMEFGSFFAHPEASVAAGVYIGANCILGRTSIGARTQIGSGVQVISGKKQHPRDAEGRIMGSEHGLFETVRIGADGWIGSGAILLADTGEKCTIGAGSVVVHAVAAGSVAVGNPARVIGNAAGKPV